MLGPYLLLEQLFGEQSVIISLRRKHKGIQLKSHLHQHRKQLNSTKLEHLLQIPKNVRAELKLETEIFNDC